MLCSLFHQTNAQLIHNNTGFFIDYGSNNNTGTGFWYTYSNRGNSDSCLSFKQTNDALVFEGSNAFPISQAPFQYVGFLQNRLWGYPSSSYPGYTINMSRPENMAIKVRMKSTGLIQPTNIYLKLQDTLGNITLDGSTYFIINPTSEYVDYYFNFNNSWRDMTKNGAPPMAVVDSSAISGFDFYVELATPTMNITDLKIEIDYIQLGSFVDWQYNSITGRVFNDLNSDCIFNGNDTPVKKSLVSAQPGSFYAYTDEDGFYTLKVDTLITSYLVSSIPSATEAALIQQRCPSTGSQVVSTPKGNVTYCCNNFAQKSIQCAVLKIDITSNRRRRCFTNITHVNYQNAGNINSQPAEVKVIYPQYVKPISSIPAWTRKNGDTLYYNVGVLTAYTNNVITIIDSVVCGIEDIRSLTQCTQAIILPGNTCIPESLNWDNANVVVSGTCVNGVTIFKIVNDGDGDMSDSSFYRVYVNDTLISNHKFELRSQEFFMIEIPTYGKVVRLEADQVAEHPDFNILPRASFEGCVSNQTQLRTAFKGFMMNTPQNVDFVTASSCLPIIDSYDPNDKGVSPSGVTNQNLILAGTKLIYTIRFENTGSDDAYTVEVVDTLDVDLDATTFLAGNSSHPYSIERIVVNGKEVIKFRFKNIYLTPKLIDSIKSQGFITFTISTKPSLADGELINNEASIFFDYNSAIITNMVSQTIGEYVVEDLTQEHLVLRSTVSSIATGVKYRVNTNTISIYPNPTTGNITIKSSSLSSVSTAQLNIYSINGILILSKEIAVPIDTVALQQLTQGIYYYTITDTDGLNERGKIVKQ